MKLSKNGEGDQVYASKYQSIIRNLSYLTKTIPNPIAKCGSHKFLY